MSHWVSVSAVRIKVASHLATLNHFAADLGILKRQRALDHLAQRNACVAKRQHGHFAVVPKDLRPVRFWRVMADRNTLPAFSALGAIRCGTVGGERR